MAGVLVPTKDKADWLAERRKGVTASEIAAICGVAPEQWNRPYRLWCIKTGRIPDEAPAGSDLAAMNFGSYAEPFVAGQFATARPEFQVEGDGATLYQHPERAWQMATPDRLLYEGPHGMPVAVLQCKAGSTFGWGPAGSNDVPVYYYLQVLWEMDVLGVTTAFLANCEPPGMALRIWEITLEGGSITDLEFARAQAEKFLALVDSDVPPDIDASSSTTAALKALHPDVEETVVSVPKRLAGQYRAACAAVKAAEARKSLAENLLRDRMGDSRRAVVAGQFYRDRRGILVPDVLARRDKYPVAEKVIHRRAYEVDKLVPVNPAGQQEE